MTERRRLRSGLGGLQAHGILRTNSMDISVIIPTFNRKSVLSRAVRSVLNQHVDPKIYSFELIIADDGSTDGTKDDIVREFPRIRYLRWETQKGPSFARNRAAEACS